MAKTAEIFVAQIIANGRITIPDAIRELLNLKEGDFVRVSLEVIREAKA